MAGLILAGLIFMAAGCGIASTYPSKARNLAHVARTKLSVGDTRHKVHSLLGVPLIVDESAGLEVYRFSGRDSDIDSVLVYPFPFPSPYRATGGALILYDEADKIKDLAADAMTNDYADAVENQLQYCSFRISAGGYRFFNTDGTCARPETLTGPPVSPGRLANETVQAAACSVVFLMGECPMERISIDDSQLADLSPAGSECRLRDPDQSRVAAQEKLPPETHHQSALMRGQGVPGIYRTFIKTCISPGTHRLLVSQTTRVKERDFENVFDCADGDTVYVTLDAVKARHAHGNSPPWYELEGDLAVSKTPPGKQLEGAAALSPILWHRGRWYGPPWCPRSE